MEKKLVTQLKLIAPVNVSSDEKKLDLCLTLYTANHTAIRNIDYLGELVNLQFHESEQLKEEIGGANFSIILDESTDVGCDKMMAYCIRYFNVKLRRIVVDFLGLQLVGRTTAKIQLENFLNFFQEFGLDLNKMIAIATDGASNLCGKNHSLYTLLKEKFPKLILMKCVCMSLFK